MGSLEELRSLGRDCKWLARSLQAFEEVDSTNLIAERSAEAGAEHGSAIVADRQSSGRGRMGRDFFSPGGTGLYLSLLLRPRLEPDALFQLIFGAAASVAETAVEFLPSSVSVEIKWPNDVMLNGRKTSGMNLPAKVEGGRVQWAILGIGVNIDNPPGSFPAELDDIATSLHIAGELPVDRIAFGRALLVRLEKTLDDLEHKRFAAVFDRWHDFFKMSGRRVRIGGPGVKREFEGVVSGVELDGALILSTSTGIERVLAGDVQLIESPG